MTAQPLDMTDDAIAVSLAEPPPVEDAGGIAEMDMTLADLARAIGRLSEDVIGALDADDSREFVVQLLADVRGMRQLLAGVESLVESKAVKRVPYSYKPQRVGSWLVEMNRGKNRTEWQHAKTAFAVCQNLAVDPETGAVNEDMVTAIDAVRDRLLDCAQISGWKVKASKAQGVNVDEFCTVGEQRTTLKLTPFVDEPLAVAGDRTNQKDMDDEPVIDTGFLS